MSKSAEACVECAPGEAHGFMPNDPKIQKVVDIFYAVEANDWLEVFMLAGEQEFADETPGVDLGACEVTRTCGYRLWKLCGGRTDRRTEHSAHREVDVQQVQNPVLQCVFPGALTLEECGLISGCKVDSAFEQDSDASPAVVGTVPGV